MVVVMVFQWIHDQAEEDSEISKYNRRSGREVQLV